MTEQETIQKIIEKAVARGWDMFGYRTRAETVWNICWPTIIIQNVDEDGNGIEIDNFRLPEVIFSHAFAKAFWGDENKFAASSYETTGEQDSEDGHYLYNGGIDNSLDKIIPAWQWHLQQMVVEEQPLRYLERYL
jgi:hypothetical protein